MSTFPGVDLDHGLAQLSGEQVERLITALDRLSAAMEGQTARRRPQPTTARSKAGVMARSFVRVQLLDGPKTWNDIVEAGIASGHKEVTMRRYRREVADTKFIDGHWYWQLRTESPEGS